MIEMEEKLIQGESVTIQPYWRSYYNHTRDGIVGAEHHIPYEIRPAEIAYT